MSENDTKTVDPAVDAAMITMRFMNMVAFFASPRVVAASGEIPPCEHILDLVDHFLSLVSALGTNLGGPGSRSLPDTLLHARALRDLLAAWAPEPGRSPLVVPPAIEERARALLQAHGVPEPPGGWDHFEAPSEKKKPATEATERRTETIFPGESVQSYSNALSVSITGELLCSLAEDVARRGPKGVVWGPVPPHMNNYAEGADRLLLRILKAQHGLDLLSAFLSRHAASKANRLPMRDEVLDHLATYLELSENLRDHPVSEVNRRVVSSAPHAAKLHALFLQWPPALDVPAEVCASVRDLFESLGIREPPEGWDHFEGFPPRP